MATASSFVQLDIAIGQVENLAPQGQAETGINTGVTLNTADTGITLSSGGVIKGGQTAFNTGNGFFLGYTGAQYKVSIGDPSGDNLTWDGTDLTITADAGAISGDLIVNGNFTVNGTTTTLNTATLDVEDKNITLNYGSGDTSSTANGAGITIQDAVNSTTDASILWNGATDTFDFSNSVNVTGNIVVSGTVDGRDVATDGTKLDDIEALADVTDTINVTAAGALMDSEVTNLAQVKAFDSSDYATATQGTTADNALPKTGGAMTGAITTNSTFDGRDVATDGTKLDGIEALADVTDTTNVTAAGALMDSELTDLTAVKSLDQGVATTDTPTFAGLATSADVTFGDNDKAIFGAGSDLQIYHSGSASYITDSGTGNLLIQGTDVRLQNAGATANYLKGTDGAEVSLFYAGGQKLATSSSGIDVTGTATMDGLTVNGVGSVIALSDNVVFNVNVSGGTSKTSTINQRAKSSNGANAETSIVVTGSSGEAVSAWDFKLDTANGALTKAMTIDGSGDISFYEDTGTTAKLFWDSSAESLGIGTSTPQASIHTTGDAIIGTATHGTSYEGVLQIADGAVNERTVVLIYNNHPDQFMKLGQDVNTAFIGRDQADEFAIGVFDNAADTTLSKQFVIDASGNVLVNGTNATAKLVVDGDANTYTTRVNSSATTGQAFGTRIRAGTNSSDYALLVENTSAASMLAVRGDGHVGIGTSSPTNPLHIATASTDVAKFATTGAYNFITLDNATRNWALSVGSTFSIYDNTAASTRMSVDASGNLLVGKSGTAYDTEGAQFEKGGALELTTDGARVLRLNRTSNDGNIIEFNRGAGSTVGSIGTLNSALTIGTGDTGIQFNADNNAVMPHNITTGANVDASIDIGYASGGTNRRFKDLYLSGGVRGTSTIDITIPETSGGAIKLEFGNNVNTTRRTVQAYKDNFEPAAADTGAIGLGRAGNQWKDLYLSGGVVFGATGGNVSSKTLDDYEEGTFSPVLADATTGGNASSTGAAAFYTKIGRQVFLSIHFYNIDTTGLTSGNDIFIQALPFVAKSISGAAYYTGTMYSSVLSFTRTENCYPLINDNQSYLRLGFNRDGAGFDGQQVNGITSGSTDMTFNISYMTA